MDSYHAPRMIASVRQLDGAITAYQVTRLRQDGSDRLRGECGKKISYGVLGTGAVRLGIPEDELGLAEGVETGLSAMQMSGRVALGTRLDRVAVPRWVRRLIIFSDRGEAGEKAAASARRLYLNTDVEVVVRQPWPRFKDFNDLLRERSAGRAA